MKEFIIEYELEKVKNPKTREYLQEVISSYNNENYRSALVGLYTCVIFDVLHKVVYLKDIYNSPEANEILSDIDSTRKSNPFSPVWEDELIKRVTEEFKDNKHQKEKKYLSLFDSYAYGKFKRLKIDRNNCAHPAHDSERLLRSYNRDEVRAHIRNMFEYVFLKDAILTDDICKIIDKDILKYGDSFDSLINNFPPKVIEKYFLSKYITKIFLPEKEKLFKHLWNNLTSLGPLEYSKLRFNILICLIKNNLDLCIKFFKKDTSFMNPTYLKEKMDDEYFDKNPLYLNNSFARLICLFSEYPDFFYTLPDHTKLDIKNKCKENLNYYLLAYYIDEDIDTHLKFTEELKKSIIKQKTHNNYISDSNYPCYSMEVLLHLHKLLKNLSSIDIFNKFILDFVIKSRCFFYSTCVLEDLLPIIIKDFTKNDCIKLLDTINSDSQYTDLGKYSSGKHEYLSHYLKNLKADFDNKLGENFNYSIFENIIF